MQQAVILIDNMYFQNILTEFQLFGQIDYEKFSDKLAGEDYTRLRTYVFDALPLGPSREKKQKFLDRLKYLKKFQVEQGYVKNEKKICPKCKQEIEVPRQKMVDILMASRLFECSLNPNINKIFVLAGDGDFVPAVAVAKTQKEVVLVFAETEKIGAATQLKQICDDRIVLDKSFFDDCKLAKQTTA